MVKDKALSIKNNFKTYLKIFQVPKHTIILHNIINLFLKTTFIINFKNTCKKKSNHSILFYFLFKCLFEYNLILIF